MFALATASLSAASVVQTMPTPFGHRPSECIVEVPNGAHVEEDPYSSDLIITHPELGMYRHTADPICSDPLYAPAPRVASKVPAASNVSGNNSDCNAMPCTCDSLPCNNWIDTAGWMLSPYDQGPYIGGFSTVMSVPKTPSSPDKGQTLFYFNGAENTDGTPRHGAPPPSGRAILQPVLTYAPETNCKGSTPPSKTGWCISSWYCCPKNLTVHSTYLGDVNPGEKWLGIFNLTGPDMFETDSKNVATGQETKLSCPRQGRNFNWADATLEVYAVNKCDEMAVGPMTFTENKLWDTDGKPMVPEWKLTKEKVCGGTTKLGEDGTITIEHAGGPDAA